jgi:hypothetical protein
MNLQENINRIHQMMGIINENKIADIIQEMGLYDAIRYFGGYDNLEKRMEGYVLSNDEMIRFIKDVVKHLCDVFNAISISATFDLEMGPIQYGQPDDELQNIDIFSQDFVTVDVYGGRNYDDHMESFTEEYENLDDNTLDDVFLFMIDALDKYK